jgi:hypothetical protein
MNDIVRQDIIESVVIEGDLSRLTPEQRVEYYLRVCNNLGLNPLLRPFNYINLHGKLILYPTKTCHAQLRENRKVSIDDMEIKEDDKNITVIVKGHDANGRTDVEIGVVSKEDMQGNYGNSVMKCVTKAKNRLTLSLCGLGMVDETELDTIPEVRVANVNIETGEILPPSNGNEPIDIPDNLKSGEDIVVMKPVKKPGTPPPPDNFLTADAPVKEKVTFCELHQTEMRQFSKDGKSWYSHKTDAGAWCSGKPALPIHEG